MACIQAHSDGCGPWRRQYAGLGLNVMFSTLVMYLKCTLISFWLPSVIFCFLFHAFRIEDSQCIFELPCVYRNSTRARAEMYLTFWRQNFFQILAQPVFKM